MSAAVMPTPQELAGLSREEKLALLARLSQQRQVETDLTGGESSYPLSFAQERLLFLHHLEEGENVHTQFRGLWLSGPLDVAALDRALCEIQRRHEALRTRFVPGDETHEPSQVIDPPRETLLELVEVSGADLDERRQEARRLAALEAARPFDLERGPVMRAQLLVLGPDEHALLLGLHHIVSDGWSRGLLFAELSALYGAFLAGEPSPLPAPKAQLGAFARAQRQRLQGEKLEQEINFWRARLDGAPSRLELPWDRPRRGMVTPQGELVRVSLGEETADGLRALAKEEGATSFMVLLALYNALLFRFTGQNDLVVGLPVAGRDSTALESAIGCFANTFVERIALDPGASFRDLLGRVKREIAAVLPHAEVPFEKLVEVLAPERDFSYNPIFQVMFAVQEVGEGGFSLPGLTAATMAVERAMANVDLTLELLDKRGSGAIQGFFDFATDLFDRASIERLAGQLEVLAAAIVAKPDSPLLRLPLFTPEGRTEILALGTAPERAINRPIVERFAAWAEEAGDRVAVVSGDEFWSYQGLDKQSNRLARLLIERGVKADERVGICLPRGVDQLLAVLAINKAGGAYVSLEPAYPKQRLQMMVDDARLLLILTDPQSAESLPPPIDPDEQLFLAEAGAEIARQSAEPLPPRAELDHLAYLIFTSGSTGTPKAVAVPHRGVTNHATAFIDRFRLRADCRALYSATLSFDVSCEEIYPVWCAGATLVVLPPGAFPTFSELHDLVAERRLTHIDLPTPYWHEWVHHLASGGEKPPACLELVVVGTEQASAERLGEWFQTVGNHPGWVNAYGPTETTISASAYTPNAEAWCGPLARVPIGKVIENVRAYVVDPCFEPLAPGMPGDLYLGGPGVVRGYWRRPGLSADRFVPDPFSPTPGGRLYKTGDRARFTPRGEIEFLGRLDDQVKIRGFRIELGEIAEAVRRHNRVKDCAVMVRQEEGGPMLAAYVVPTPGPPLAASELTQHLSNSLPPYMVPAVTLLAELPLTTAGKVDRKALAALPPPGREDVEEEEKEEAPLDPITATVAAVWCSVLGLAKIGPEEDFFEIGGHSLLATRVIARLKQALGVDIGLAAFFDARTIAALSRRVAAERQAGRKTAPPLVVVPREGGVVCSFSQQRLWFLDRLLPDSPANHIPQLLRFSGQLSVRALEAALGNLVRRHESLRTTFGLAKSGPLAGKVLQHIAPPAPAGRRGFVLPTVDLSALAPESSHGNSADDTIERLATRESLRRFDLARGPMLRATLLRRSASEQLLDLSTHHIVSDGVSIGLLIAELVALYGELAGGSAANLPPLPVAYADFAAWQRGWLEGEALDEQMSYWRRVLAGAPAALDMPFDRPRPPLETYNGRRVPLLLPTELVSGLEALGRSHGATLFMVLTALFKALLARFSAQDDVVMGWPISGRNLPELERVQGFFSNILVLRTDLSGRPTLGTLVERVRASTLGAYDHQEMPFEKLVEELSPERNLAHNPIFQVFFVLHHQSGGRLPRLPGVEISVPSFDNRTSRLDLLLSLMESSRGLTGFFEYNTDLFDHSTISRLATYLPRLAEAALAAPQRALAGLDLLETAARQQLIHEWNDTQSDPAALLPTRLAQVTQERPGNIAVRFAGTTLSYAELDLQSSRLAQHLLALGLRPEEPVGVALERNLELPVVLLAVLRAGGAYLPLDPGFPAARLDYVRRDSGARLLLTQPELRHLFDEDGLEVVEILAGLEGIPEPSAPQPLPALDLDQLAYLIYTSGSTGNPKGVAVPHRGVASFLSTMALNPGLSSHDVLFAVTTISFDIHVLELWLPLVCGAQVEVVDAATAADGKLLARALEEGQATVMQATPATWRQLLHSGWAGRPDLTALCGGEALTEDLAAELAPRVKRLVNVYGPTETTVWSARERVRLASASATDSASRRAVSIGRPIAATSLHLLDPQGGITLTGTVGELAIGGVGVVRGYHGKPALTAERFTPDPYTNVAGSRLYKTGDLCRQLQDGRLEFRRRRDHQVKVRGFRIELGEVESVLGRHPAVAQCVAAVDAVGTDNERLVAYFVAAPQNQGGAGVSPGKLRAALKEQLPDYMIPSLLVPLDALPLTPNGKVDRKALPSPQQAAAPEREYTPPVGQVEEALVEIWAEVLKVERVGRNDRFFDLGGHSLMATQVLTRVHERFGVEVPLRALFEANTVAALAEVIIAKELEGVDSDLLARLLANLDAEPTPEISEMPSAASDRRSRGDVDA